MQGETKENAEREATEEMHSMIRPISQSPLAECRREPSDSEGESEMDEDVRARAMRSWRGAIMHAWGEIAGHK